MFEFQTIDGQSVWVGVFQVVSMQDTRDNKGAMVKLSDGTVVLAQERAFDLGMRLNKAIGSIISGKV